MTTRQLTDRTPVESTVPSVLWPVSLVAGLWGIALALAGRFLYRTASYDRVAAWVAEGHLTSVTMSDSQLAESAVLLQSGGGLLLVTMGLGLLAAGLTLGYRAHTSQPN